MDALLERIVFLSEKAFAVPQPQVKTIEKYLSLLFLLPIFYVVLVSYQIADANYRSPGRQREILEVTNIIRNAGKAIKDHTNNTDLIMTRWGLAGYYADRPVLITPQGTPEEVIEYGRINGARFLLVDTLSVDSHRQELKELLRPLDGKQLDSKYGLEMCYLDNFENVGGYVIYRVLGR